MSEKPKARQSLSEILQSTSDTLFPADLGERKVDLDSQDVDGDTPLHVVLWRDDYYAAETLIEAGAKLDAIGDMGETPLHVAINRGNVRATRALLEAGADTKIRSEFGKTADELLRESSLAFLMQIENR